MAKQESRRGFSGPQVTGIVLAVMGAMVALTVFAARAWLFPRPFQPVVLNAREEQQLEEKLQRFEAMTGQPVQQQAVPAPAASGENEWLADGSLKPEAYSEEEASRAINFSERELNALLAKNTDLARKLIIDLADNLVSAKLLVPVDPDFPVLGGKTLRVRAGVELAYRQGRPVVKLRGISIMGVPMPNAWLGGLKNIDLVREFGTDKGFWKAFSDGVESITVREGRLHIQLKE